MRGIRCLLAAVLAAGMVTVVAAQPGLGGFGFGGGGDVESLVFTNTALQEELKLTDAQKEKFKPIVEKQADLEKRSKELFAKGFKDFDKDKAAELRKDGEKLAEDSKKVRDEVLSADQKKRLKQINIQNVGIRIFGDPEAKGMGPFGGVPESRKALMKEVQEGLKFTDAQKKTIKDVTADYNKEVQEISKDVFGEGKGSFKNRQDPEKQAEFQKKQGKVQKEAMTKIEDAFDADQKKAWKDMIGDAFDTSKLRQQPPKKD